MRSSRNRHAFLAGAGLWVAIAACAFAAQGQTAKVIKDGQWVVVRGTAAELKIWPKGRILSDKTKVCIGSKGVLVLASKDGKRHRTYVGPGCNKVLKNGHLLPPNNPATTAGAIRAETPGTIR